MTERWQSSWRGALCCLFLLALGASTARGQDSASYPPLADVIRIGVPRLTIGEEMQPGPALFGFIVSVTADGDGHTYVLDRGDYTIRRFSPAGEHVATAGQRGRGPGDLEEPYSLWHDGDHTLYVVDRLNGINVFDTDDSRITYRRRFLADRWPRAICRLGGRLIVAGYHNEHVVHAIDEGGQVRQSFGEPFQRDTMALLEQVANSGSIPLACDEQAGRLYLTQGAGGHVRAYDAQGTLLWETALPGFLGSRVLRDRRGAVVVLFPKHITEAIRPIGPRHVIVQAHHKERRAHPSAIVPGRPRGMEIDLGIVTYVLDAETGHVITRQYAGPILMAAMGDELVGYDDDPFPRVFVLRATAVSR